MAIDLRELDEELRRMRSWQPIYKTVKRALSERGHWKNKPRGKADPQNFGGSKNGK